MADYWPQVITGIATLLGALVGGGVTAWNQNRSAKAQRHYEAASLALAFATEIGGLLRAIEIRKDVERARMVVASLRGEAPPMKEDEIKSMLNGAQYDDPLKNLIIYSTHVADIGKIGKFAEDIATFYQGLIMARKSISYIENEEFSKLPKEHLASFIESELSLWLEHQQLGQELLPKLKAFGRQEQSAMKLW